MSSRPRGSGRNAIVVDPGDDPHRLIDAATDVTVTAIVLTDPHRHHRQAME